MHSSTWNVAGGAAFAVHDDNVTSRFHHVSFPLTLGVGTKGTISSVALK